MSEHVENLLDKSGVGTGADKAPVDYVALAFQTRLYLEVAIRALDKISNGIGDAQEIAKQVIKDLDVVEYKPVSDSDSDSDRDRAELDENVALSQRLREQSALAGDEVHRLEAQLATAKRIGAAEELRRLADERGEVSVSLAILSDIKEAINANGRPYLDEVIKNLESLIMIRLRRCAAELEGK